MVQDNSTPPDGQGGTPPLVSAEAGSSLNGLSVPELMTKLVEFTDSIKAARIAEIEATANARDVLARLAAAGFQMTVPELQPVTQGVVSAPVNVTSEGETPVAGTVVGAPIVPELGEEKPPAGRDDGSSDDEMSEEDWAAEIERRAKSAPDTRNAEAIRTESRVSPAQAAQTSESEANQMANGLNQAIAAGFVKANIFSQTPGGEGYRVG